MAEEMTANAERQFDLTSFKRATEKMIATNDRAYNSTYWGTWIPTITRIRNYTPEEIQRIIESGSLAEQQKLSRNYFYKDGYYKQIIIHYATLLKYVGLLIPNAAGGKTLSTQNVSKKYNSAIDYIESMSLPTFFTNCAQRALVDGCYFGAKIQVDSKHFAVIDLPCGYCMSRFKDEQGNDLVEFNVTYFDTISDLNARKTALAVYPKVISDAYKRYSKTGNTTRSKKECTPWVVLPPTIGICFPFFDGRPLFLNVIPKTLEYDVAVDTEQQRNLEEIRKIIVQKIPHTQDGKLLFEPDEAEVMHQGAVSMLRKNENLSVLTTYADVEAIVSKTTADNAQNTLERMEQNIYAQAGISPELFATKSATALEKSLQQDLALMMYMANKFARFITNIINELFSNSNVSFKYTILPVSYYNSEKYVNTAFKLVGSGYSFLMPALAMGLSQRDLGNVKDLENNILKLDDKLIPLQTSYTMSKEQEASDNKGGRPTKDIEGKQEVTVVTEESRQNTEGGSSLND